MTKQDRLDEMTVAARVKQLDGWELDDNRLYRRFEFSDFVEAFGFMTSVALVAEKANHHPDWSNSYKTVEIHLSSHDVDGISERDFDLAERINAIRGG